MLASMTGFARIEEKLSWGQLTWEIRSVNQRFLEANFRLPDSFRNLESILRNRLKQAITRGKIESNLRIEMNHDTNLSLQLNEDYLKMVVATIERIQTITGQGKLNILELLKYPGVLQDVEYDIDAMSKELLGCFDKLLTNFIETRQREGIAIRDMLNQRLDAMQLEIEKIKLSLPKVAQAQRERILQKYAELQLQPDPTRLEQELLFLLQRMDIAEETDRLITHIKEVQNILQQQGAVGRKLDFMMQELNREANTIASKSTDVDVTQAAVELKVLIEQMREQVQNLE